jgi:hypothetical protein
MVDSSIEYCVSRGSQNDWRVFRQGRQFAVRGDVFDAVSLATLFAEREARSCSAAVKLMLGEGRVD